ncbi:Peroxidase 51 [Ancistrocladus abbreviatus]
MQPNCRACAHRVWTQGSPSTWTPPPPRKFDNVSYKNLMKGLGLFTSDQVLYTDGRSRPLVVDWANSAQQFNQAFIEDITKLGRVGVKTGSDWNIRIRCDAFN